MLCHAMLTLCALCQAGAHWFSFATTAETRKQAMDELAFQALSGLAVTEPDCGVSSVRAHALFEKKPEQHLARPWWHGIVPRFRDWTEEELARHSEASGVRYVAGFSYESLMICAPHYLAWLYRQFIADGGQLRTQRLQHIREAWQGVPASEQPDVVVNCLGLGARTLGGVEDNTMFADRGQTVLVSCEQIREIWRAPGPDATYVLPRGDGTVVLGGTHIKDGSAASQHALLQQRKPCAHLFACCFQQHLARCCLRRSHSRALRSVGSRSA